MRFGITMTPEGHAETLRQLRALVNLRNELVHHLIERFDVWTLHGCREAVAHLDATYLKIDVHYASLTTWATTMQEAHALTGSLFASKAWQDFYVHGIAPEGAVDWPRAKVVELLREAGADNARDGWINLADAIAFIGARRSALGARRSALGARRSALGARRSAPGPYAEAVWMFVLAPGAPREQAVRCAPGQGDELSAWLYLVPPPERDSG